MDSTSGFARLARLGDMTLSPSVPGVSTALAQALYARADGAGLAPASRCAPAAGRAPPRSRRIERPWQPSGRVA
ncbi:MAG: hypothetical protein ACLQJR_21145 [Stellaceae bacterium]